MKNGKLALMLFLSIIMLQINICIAVNLELGGRYKARVQHSQENKLEGQFAFELIAELENDLGPKQSRITFNLFGPFEKWRAIKSIEEALALNIAETLVSVQTPIFGTTQPVTFLAGSIQVDYSNLCATMNNTGFVLEEIGDSARLKYANRIREGFALKKLQIGRGNADGFLVWDQNDPNRLGYGVKWNDQIRIKSNLLDYNLTRVALIEEKAAGLPKFQKDNTLEIEMGYGSKDYSISGNVALNNKYEQDVLYSKGLAALLELELSLFKPMNFQIATRYFEPGFDPYFRDRSPLFGPDGGGVYYNPVDKYIKDTIIINEFGAIKEVRQGQQGVRLAVDGKLGAFYLTSWLDVSRFLYPDEESFEFGRDEVAFTLEFPFGGAKVFTGFISEAKHVLILGNDISNQVLTTTDLTKKLLKFELPLMKTNSGQLIFTYAYGTVLIYSGNLKPWNLRMEDFTDYDSGMSSIRWEQQRGIFRGLQLFVEKKLNKWITGFDYKIAENVICTLRNVQREDGITAVFDPFTERLSLLEDKLFTLEVNQKF